MGVGVVAHVVLQVFLCVHLLNLHGSGRVDLWLHIVGWLAEVLGLARTYIIYIDIRIGGDRVCQTSLLATGVGDALRIRTPCQLLDWLLLIVTS